MEKFIMALNITDIIPPVAPHGIVFAGENRDAHIISAYCGAVCSGPGVLCSQSPQLEKKNS